MEEEFYVGIKGATGIRRELLGSSKDIIHILKNYDRVNDIRREKAENVIRLKGLIAEIRRLNEILKEKIPQDVRATPPKSIPVEKTTPKKVITKPVVSKKDARVHKLESELNEIESRLAKLS